MATGAKPETPVEEANKKSKMNPPPKLLDVNSSLKDGNLSDATSCASSGDTTSTVKETDPHRGLSYYPINYYGYYYPVSFSEGDDQNYVGGNEGLETQQTAFPADNSSVPYYALGFEHGFNPYSPFMPGAYLSPDGQYLGQHGYFGGPMFSPPVLSPVAYSPDLVPGYTWDTSYIYGDGTNGSVLGDSPVYCPAKQVDSLDKAASLGRAVSPSSAQTPKAGNKVSKFSSFPQARSTFSVKENSQKTRNKLGVNEGEFLNEQNRGPRTGSQKCGSETGSEDGHAHSISQDVVVKHENYNLDEFPTKYEHALFFVIKSYSEDDVHKSIKYNVWASTPNGNQRLDNAFQIAQSKMEERGCKCPVFLFFSVNASGQFCGVAEMTGRVNFNKSMDFWQQDKWNGFFPVKWHIIKDVPNSLFRHIILENNDNKPVTNSRDTQEVKFSQGIEVLNIFKGFTAKTSILDDFGFYDNRQKAMQSRRIKVNAPQPVVNKTAADVSPLIAGLQAIQLGPAKSGGEPSKALGVKE